MIYNTFSPSSDLSTLINCYWTLEVPASDQTHRQRIIPDGSIEMAFLLGEDIKRFTNEEEYIIQPRSMVIGQITQAYVIEPVGYVNTFAIRFFPYGIAHFLSVPIKDLANKETSIHELFDSTITYDLEQKIVSASDTEERIIIIEEFLRNQMNDERNIDKIVKSTIESLIESKGNAAISSILKNDKSKRRQLERKFISQIGLSPKQLAKFIRINSALKLLLNNETNSLTDIAYQSEFYDQAHFIKDFKEFTGISPKEFMGNDNMALSTIFYK